jgi:thioredoxin 1
MLSLGVSSFAVEEQSGANAFPDPFLDLNDSTVNDAIASYPLFVLDCYISGCEPCEAMNITLSELSIEMNGQPVAFGKIDMYKNIETARRYNVTLYPTLLIFKNGTLESRDLGFESKSLIVKMINTLEPSMNTSRVKSAETP